MFSNANNLNLLFELRIFKPSVITGDTKVSFNNLRYNRVKLKHKLFNYFENTSIYWELIYKINDDKEYLKILYYCLHFSKIAVLFSWYANNAHLYIEACCLNKIYGF